MAYQVVKRCGKNEDILGIFPRREHAELFRDAYVSRMIPFWIVLLERPEETIVYDQENDEHIDICIR